jgi:hypothetical protein
MKDASGAFRAILWKELRATWRFAALVMLVVGATLTFALQQQVGVAQGDFRSDTIMEIFAMVIIAPMFGWIIGMAQVIYEGRGDKWSFLTHRPVSRSTLFWGKVLVGVTLYVAATGIPLACAVLWAAAPGHLPLPFDSRFALPGIADLLCGLVYYFVGLLVGMREARWHGSRLMSVGVGVVTSIGVLVAPAFWQAAALCAAGVLVSGAAAWGTFVSGGVYETQPRITRAAAGVSIAAGLMLVGVLAICIPLSFIPSQPSEIIDSSDPHQSVVYALASDGTPVQTVRESGEIVAINDTEGRPLERYKERTARENLRTGVMVAETLINPGNPDWQRNQHYRSTDDIFVQLNLFNSGGPVAWYFIPDLELIAAYDNRSARLIGWLGPDGFKAGEAKPVKRFDGSLQNRSQQSLGSLLVFRDVVYRLDLNQRHIESIFVAPTGETILGAASTNNDPSALIAFGERARFDVIATTKKVYVQSPGGTQQLAAPRDPLAARYGTVAVYRALQAPGAPTFVWYYPTMGQIPVNQWMKLPLQVTKFGNGDAAVAHFSLTFPPTPMPRTPWAGVIVPSLLEPVTARIAIDITQRVTGRQVQATPVTIFSMGTSRQQQIAGWFLPLLTSLVSMAVTFARGKTYAFAAGRLWLWTVLGFALGPLGVLLMLSLIEWPALEKCPACHRKRVVTRERCEHCNEPFAPAPKDGTEIFEPVL